MTHGRPSALSSGKTIHSCKKRKPNQGKKRKVFASELASNYFSSTQTIPDIDPDTMSNFSIFLNPDQKLKRSLHYR